MAQAPKKPKPKAPSYDEVRQQGFSYDGSGERAYTPAKGEVPNWSHLAGHGQWGVDYAKQQLSEIQSGANFGQHFYPLIEYAPDQSTGLDEATAQQYANEHQYDPQRAAAFWQGRLQFYESLLGKAMQGGDEQRQRLIQQYLGNGPGGPNDPAAIEDTLKRR